MIKVDQHYLLNRYHTGAIIGRSQFVAALQEIMLRLTFFCFYVKILGLEYFFLNFSEAYGSADTVVTIKNL